MRYVGAADVLGVKDIGGVLSSDFEVVAVEVKKTKASFGKSLGQALGYSLFSHKCYLAIPSKKNEELFSIDDREIASHLGVGLIEIDVSEDQCYEIVTSKPHKPIETILFHTLNNLGLIKCSICGTLKERDYYDDYPKKVGIDFYYYDSVFDGEYDEEKERVKKVKRPLLYTKEKYPRRLIFICKNCVEKLKFKKP